MILLFCRNIKSIGTYTHVHSLVIFSIKLGCCGITDRYITPGYNACNNYVSMRMQYDSELQEIEYFFCLKDLIALKNTVSILYKIVIVLYLHCLNFLRFNILINM